MLGVEREKLIICNQRCTWTSFSNKILLNHAVMSTIPSSGPDTVTKQLIMPFVNAFCNLENKADTYHTNVLIRFSDYGKCNAEGIFSAWCMINLQIRFVHKDLVSRSSTKEETPLVFPLVSD